MKKVFINFGRNQQKPLLTNSVFISYDREKRGFKKRSKRKPKT